MASIGILLMILGFGSLILAQFNMEFRLLSFLTEFQPWAGIIIGLIGLALLVLGLRNRTAPTTEPIRDDRVAGDNGAVYGDRSVRNDTVVDDGVVRDDRAPRDPDVR